MFRYSTKDRTRRHRARHLRTLEILRENGARKILDIGCAEGKLLELMNLDSFFSEMVGIDPNAQSLAEAAERLRGIHKIRFVNKMAEDLDGEFKNYDAVTLVEVIEHMSEDKLVTFSEKIFGHLSPKVVVVMTPLFVSNSGLGSRTKKELSQLDHYFEWTKMEFERWAALIAQDYGYNFKTEMLKFSQLNRGTQVATFIKKST